MAAPKLHARILAELTHGARSVVELATATGEPRGDVASACWLMYDTGLLDNEAGVFVLRGALVVAR